MKVRTLAFVLAFSLMTEIVGAMVVGILGIYEAIETGNTENMPSPYREIFWLAVGLAAVTMAIIGLAARKMQDHYWLSRAK